MKKIHNKVVSLLCAFGVFTTVFSGAAGYLGSAITVNAADEITISTVTDLQKIGNDEAYPLSGDYVLANDINMSGVDFTPIGGGVGTRGADSGDNVFTGTFDGAGHIISNLTIEKSGEPSNDNEAWQYGLFGMIGNTDSSDPAIVENLILTGVDISVDMHAVSTKNYLSLGALAGEVNHNAHIQNVAVVDGKIEGNPSEAGDVVGVGGLIGEMRYEVNGGAQANGVTVSNIYVGADVISGSSTSSNYAAGIVGRIAKTYPEEMKACVFTGNSTFRGLSGYGISGGDMTANVNDCYYVSGASNTGTAVDAEDLKEGKLLDGLDSTYWTAAEGIYVMLNQCLSGENADTLIGTIAVAGLSIDLKKNDSASAIEKDFEVPTSIVIGETEENITWTSNAPEGALTFEEDGTVTVDTSKVFVDTPCILTATIGTTGKTKEFSITIKSAVAVEIKQEYATVGEALTAAMVNEPEDMTCTYIWSIDGTQVGTGESYTITTDDLEKMLTVTATTNETYGSIAYTAQMYISKLPVVYVNTENGAEIVSKEDYLNGELKIQGNAEYNSENTTLYDGVMEIRGRGNTTWSYAKKPYKMKLDKKTDIFGFGSNKHWVLLANYTDESHMRNMLAYDLSGEMGMPHMQSVHVDLILNGEYKGTYQFCEQVKISKARVNIYDWEDGAEDVAKAIYYKEKNNGMGKDDRDAIEEMLAETDMSWMTTGKVVYTNDAGETTTYTIDDYVKQTEEEFADEDSDLLDEALPAGNGGYLMELDSYYDEVSKFKSNKNQPLMFKSPEFIYTNTDAMNYVKGYINAFESAIDASDFTTTYNGNTVSYSQLFDMDSLVQFWLVQELFYNVDAMKKSSYMYKPVDDKFYMGPIWDMDWSSGSITSSSQGSTNYSKWQTQAYSDAAQTNQWYKSIIKDPYFAVEAYELYKDMRDEMQAMVADGGKMDKYEALLQESAEANRSLWYTNSWDMKEYDKAFSTYTGSLKTYLTNRLNWLDKQFTSPDNLAKSLGYSAAAGISLEVKPVKTAENEKAIDFTAAVTNANAKYAAFMVDGIKKEVVEITDGSAVLRVAEKDLEADVYNTIQVYALNANQAVLTTSGKAVTDYAAVLVSELTWDGESSDTGNPDDGKDDTDNPDDGKDNTDTSNGEKNDSEAAPEVTSITLSVTDILLPKGETTTLLSTVQAQEGADKTVTYQSSDTSVATVDANGTITAMKGGTAVITATAGKKTAECTVTVAEVTLNVSTAPMQKKQKTTAIKVAACYPSGDTVRSWESSDTSVASVNQKGKITAKKTGTAVITVVMKSGAKASCTIKVQKGKVKTKKLSLSQNKLTLKKGKTVQLVLNRVPVTANDKVTYTVKNKKIVKVTSKGKLLA